MLRRASELPDGMRAGRLLEKRPAYASQTPCAQVLMLPLPWVHKEFLRSVVHGKFSVHYTISQHT